MLAKALEWLPGGARLLSLWERVRSSYWFVPSLMLLASIGLAFLMLLVDDRVDSERLRETAWFHRHETSGARELLSTIAGSMITVAGVTFSITIVALTLASSQYGPRLMRSFMRDPGNQIVLGTFIATFMYCLLVLRTIRDAEDDRFIPYLSITVAILLAVLSLGVLIYFIHHTAASIQVANLVARVGESLEKGIDKLYPQKAFFPERLGRGPSEETEPGLPGGFEEEAASLRADRSGYLQTVDEDGLLETATEHDLVIRLKRRPGDFIVKSKVLVRVWPGERLDEALFGEFKDKFAIGVHRSQEQDLGFLFEELVEVALRALSTGIDDPLTAVMCLDRIGAALAQLAAREIPSPYRYDEAGKLRVIAPPLTFAEAVKLTLAPIRRHGADDAMVLAHLLKTTTDVAEFVGKPRDREVLLAEAALVVRSARKNLQEEEDVAPIERAYQRAVAALQHQDLAR